VRRDLRSVQAVLGCLVAGVPVAPVDADGGPTELGHQLHDADPELILVGAEHPLPDALAGRGVRVARVGGEVGVRAGVHRRPAEVDPAAPALIVYTSGTTGPPKGAVLTRAAANLDALAEVWSWTTADTLVHSLPLHHVHGLVLGVLGPVRLGAALHHTGRFSPAATAGALREGGTMLFGVPTVYARLADALDDAELGPTLAGALAEARLLVSGSAGLPAPVAARLQAATGHRVIERYGMTETCIITAVPAASPRPGTVGPPLPGTEVRVVDAGGLAVAADGEAMGEVLVRSPSLFLGYHGRPEATAAVVDAEGWFHTGDLATCDPNGWLRIVGRRSIDLISSGGFKIGAGEVEAALLDHPVVAEAAVKPLPHPDLGEQVAAWVVLRPDVTVDPAALIDHVAAVLVAHKRPRQVFVVEDLPRNPMGKVIKARLVEPDP
jgi:malonyl-CoA/methylmalonyl-CoA synthetase